MQLGARFVVFGRGYAWVDGRASKDPTLRVGKIGRPLHHEGEVSEVLDVGAWWPRVAVAYRTKFSWRLASTDAAFRHAERRPVPDGTCRVAITETTTFVASDSAVHALRPEADMIAPDPIDLASAGTMLAVLDPRGITWFDSDGHFESRRLLSDPTAIATDPIEGGWLVANGGDVLHLRGATDEPQVLARELGVITKLRRDRHATYARVNRTLYEIWSSTVQPVPALESLSDFDVGSDGLHILDDGWPFAMPAR